MSRILTKISETSLTYVRSPGENCAAAYPHSGGDDANPLGNPGNKTWFTRARPGRPDGLGHAATGAAATGAAAPQITKVTESASALAALSTLEIDKDGDGWLWLYDGAADVSENYEERSGAALSFDLVRWLRLTPGAPVLTSPAATGSLRYIDYADTGDARHFCYEYAVRTAPTSCGSPALR